MERTVEKILTDIRDASLETFADFIQQLNVLRKNLATYPADHPVLSRTTDKVFAVLPSLFASADTIQCAVVKQALFLNGIKQNPQNAVFQNFSAALSSKGIVLLRFVNGLTRDEIWRFCHLLNQTPEDILTQGGIDEVLKQTQLQHITALKMNYNLFRAVAGKITRQDGKDQKKEAESLWEKFVRLLLEGTATELGEVLAKPILDPGELADFLNRNYKTYVEKGSRNNRRSLDFLLEKLEQEGVESYFYYLQAMENFGRFVENLSPQLRSQLVRGLIESYETRSSSVDKVLERFSSRAILEILADLNAGNSAMSQKVFHLVKSLPQNAAPDVAINSSMKGKLRSLFREDIGEKFLNSDYQKTLDTLIKHEYRTSEDILIEVPNPQEWLSPHIIELQLGRIVLELLDSASALESQEEIKKNIEQFLNYLVETIDFTGIHMIYRRLAENLSKADDMLADFYRELLALFARLEFTREILKDIHAWDRKKLDECQRLIESIGHPLVPALLERLAAETKRVTRRFLLDQLFRVAPQGPIDPILPYLQDSRWYVVRNIVLILREIGDSSCLKALESVVSFPHPKVRFEVLNTFLYFKYPLGLKCLLEDLGSENGEIRINAIILAKNSQAGAVREKLLELLQKKGFNAIDLKTKKQIVKTLGTIKDPAALPVLKKLLSSSSFLNPIKNRELKKEITRSLSNYPASAARETLQEVASS